MSAAEDSAMPNETPPTGTGVSTPRPGSEPSHPSSPLENVELPYVEELQEWLGGGYVVESFLGQGGMGAVYRGLQLPLRRPVAIKILAKGAGGDFGFEERFRREAYAMAALTHPNIVQVYDFGDAGPNFLFISMEFVDGGDLSEALKARTITPDTALKLTMQICEGLEAAHRHGIVHRDIKPANIFLTADGRAKVADFGLAKNLDSAATMVTKTGLGMGTPDYAAPEQYEPELGVDHRADIYALGVMMYQMLTGRLPRGSSIKPPSQAAGVDPRIDPIVARAMASEREDRYQTVAGLMADLAALKAAPRASGVVPATPTVSAAVPVTARSSQPALPHKPTAPQPRVASGPVRTAATPAQQQKKPRSSSSMTSMLIAFGVFALIAVGAFFLLGRKPAGAAGRGASDQPPAAASTAPGDRTPGVWVRPFQSEKDLPQKMVESKKIAWKDGWIIPDKSSPGMMAIPKWVGENCGVRVTFRYGVEDSYSVGQLHLRKKDDSIGRYTLGIATSGRRSSIRHTIPKSKTESRLIAQADEGSTVASGSEVTAEFFVIGNRLIARIDGKLLPPATDDALKNGAGSIQTKSAFKDVMFINLDGVPEAEALRLAGVDALGYDARGGK